MISIRSWAFRSLISGTVLLASCGFKKTDSGVEYKVIEDNDDSAKVELGGALLLDMKFFNEKDTFSSAKLYKEPVRVPLPDSIPFAHSIEAVLATLHKGDSVVIKMSSDSLYKNIFQQEVPKELEENSKTTFEIRIVNVLTKDSVRKMQEAYMAEQQRAVQARQVQYQQDTIAIADYLKKNKIKAQRTMDGVYYTITKKGSGLVLQPGDTAKTFYAGRLLDGKPFDSNVGKDPFPVVVGVSGVIRGWHSALGKMKKGEKATVYIPSMLGYGEEGAGERIPPNSILVFDIEVVK
jgi:FKBP-type peptidyl-prolyl cis-trans isomerase FkpA